MHVKFLLGCGSLCLHGNLLWIMMNHVDSQHVLVVRLPDEIFSSLANEALIFEDLFFGFLTDDCKWSFFLFSLWSNIELAHKEVGSDRVDVEYIVCQLSVELSWFILGLVVINDVSEVDVHGFSAEQIFVLLQLQNILKTELSVVRLLDTNLFLLDFLFEVNDRPLKLSFNLTLPQGNSVSSIQWQDHMVEDIFNIYDLFRFDFNSLWWRIR